MKIIVTHEIDLALDTTLADIRSVTSAASRSFCGACAPIGRASIVSIKSSPLILAGKATEKDLIDIASACKEP